MAKMKSVGIPLIKSLDKLGLLIIIINYTHRLVEPKEFTIASFYGQIHDPGT